MKNIVEPPAYKCPNYTDFLSEVRAYEKERETKELRKKCDLSNAQVKVSNKAITIHENTTENCPCSFSSVQDSSLSMRVKKREESLKDSVLHTSVKWDDTAVGNVHCNTIQGKMVEEPQKATFTSQQDKQALLFL